MKDLYKDFAARVKGTETPARITSKKDPAGNIEYTAITVYLRRDNNDRIQLLNVTKYYWLQTEDVQKVPSLEAMKLSEISIFGNEIPLFLKAVDDVVRL